MSILQTADPSEVRALKHDPRLWMRNAWSHPNRPNDQYDFRTTDGEQSLDYLLSNHGPLNPSSWGEINVFLMARGCLKTTTMLGITSWAMQFYPGIEGYMTAPREGQVKEFVSKFDEIVEQTGLDTHREKGSIGHQKFQYTAEDGTPRYANFKTDTGWGEGDALRGPHSHFGIIDEFQDLTERSFQVFSECIDQELGAVPYFPSIFVLGTPKMEGSFFEEMWQRSDMRNWDADKGAWVKQSEPATYGSGDDEQTIHGWHIDQYNCPLHSEGAIERKRDTKDEMAFRNEVLAQFYSPEDELLSKRHIDAIADDSLAFTRHRQYDDSHVTIGVDWGGGEDRKSADTVVIVAEHIDYDERSDDSKQGVVSYIRQMDFLDTSLSKNDEFERIEKYIRQYDADIVLVDEGYGTKRREDLQEGNHTIDPTGYDNLVVGCRFGNVSDVAKAKWKDTDRKRLVTVDKTHMAKTVVDLVKSQQVVLPSQDLRVGPEDAAGTKFYDQVTAPYEQRKTTATGRKRTTITADSNRNDDAFDALVFCLLAYHDETIGPNTGPVAFSTVNKPGLS